MEEEASVEYALLKTEAQGRHVPSSKTLAFHEPEAHGLFRRGGYEVDAPHASRLPLEPPGARGPCVPGRGDALGEASPKHGETAAAKGMKETAVPDQDMWTPACQGGKNPDQPGILECRNAMKDCMVGNVQAPPDCGCIQYLAGAYDKLFEQLPGQRYAPFQAVEAQEVI